jgi:hypothetical protein
MDLEHGREGERVVERIDGVTLQRCLQGVFESVGRGRVDAHALCRVCDLAHRVGSSRFGVGVSAGEVGTILAHPIWVGHIAGTARRLGHDLAIFPNVNRRSVHARHFPRTTRRAEYRPEFCISSSVVWPASAGSLSA